MASTDSPGAGGDANPASNLPLEGIRVLDVGTRISAPFCAGLLGELGADVIKVDPLITVSFVQCSDEKCSPAVSQPTSVEAASWTTSDLNTTVEAILQSLAIS